MKTRFCAALALLALPMFPCQCPVAMAQAADANPRDWAGSADADAGPGAGRIAGVAIPGAFVVYGLVSLKSGEIRKYDRQARGEILEDNQLLHTNAEDYLQFAPGAAAYVLKFTGVESRNSLLDMTLMYGLSNALGSAIVWGAKDITNRERPDGSNHKSFPSGHTETAFVAAEFLHQEYGGKSVWFDIGGYGVAALVGAARVYKNRHWVSDVVAGAGLGMLCTKGVYWVYPRLKAKWLGGRTNANGREGGRGKMQIAPVIDCDGAGASLALVCRF